MKKKEIIKILILGAVFIFTCTIVYYFVFFLPKKSNIISNILKCNELYEIKKTKYWGDNIGQSKAIYNKELNTCLALNIYYDIQTRKYFAMILDMLDDATLMYYNSTPEGSYLEKDKVIKCKENYIYFEFVQHGKTIKEYGCDTDEDGIIGDKFGLFDKMFKKVRDSGFKVFDGFSSK